jgi:hypothetical protein
MIKRFTNLITYAAYKLGSSFLCSESSPVVHNLPKALTVDALFSNYLRLEL